VANEFEQERVWRSDVAAFFLSAKRHWINLVTGGFCAAVVATVAIVGFNIRPLIGALYSFAFLLIYAAFLSFRDQRRAAENSNAIVKTLTEQNHSLEAEMTRIKNEPYIRPRLISQRPKTGETPRVDLVLENTGFCDASEVRFCLKKFEQRIWKGGAQVDNVTIPCIKRENKIKFQFSCHAMDPQQFEATWYWNTPKGEQRTDNGILNVVIGE
jgi:hypothetical protein